MASFALAVCADEKIKDITSRKMIGRFANRIFNTFKHRKMGIIAEKAEIYDDLSVYLIKLPVSINELTDANIRRITEHITWYCTENGINDCFFPQGLAKMCGFKGCMASLSKDKYIFKSLFLNILEEVYKKRNVDIASLDIIIVQGDNNEEFFSVIRALSPIVKYLKLFAYDKVMVESEADKVFEDYGLSIGITSDFKNSLKNSNLIIILGSMNGFSQGMKVRKDTLVLNYGDEDISSIFCDCTIINNVEITLPERIASRIKKEYFNNFSRIEIAKIILKYRIDEGEATGNAFSSNAIRVILREFSEGGFKISGLVGRRNVINIKDIKVNELSK